MTLAKSPNKLPFIRALQTVKTGPPGTFVQISHQVEHKSIVACLEQLKRQVWQAKEMESNVIQMRPNKSN